METWECLELKTKPDLVIMITNALCSGLTQGEGGSGGGCAVFDAGPPIFTPDNKVWTDQIWADQIRARRVCSAMKFELLGRLMFTYVLKHIRKCLRGGIHLGENRPRASCPRGNRLRASCPRGNRPGASCARLALLLWCLAGRLPGSSPAVAALDRDAVFHTTC